MCPSSSWQNSIGNNRGLIPKELTGAKWPQTVLLPRAARMANRIVLGELGGIALEANPERSYASAAVELTFLEKEFLRTGDLDRAGHTAVALAECLRRTGNAPGAEEMRKNALGFFYETRNIRGLAWTEWNIGTDCRQRGLYDEAKRHLVRSYGQAFEAGDFLCAIYALAGIAETSRIQGDYGRALAEHVYVLRQFRSLRDPRGIVWAYEGIGQIHRNRGRLSMALHCFEQARRIAFESGDIRGLGWAAKGLGDVRSLLGQRAEGLADLRLSLEIFRSSGAQVALAYSQKTLGDALLRAGRIDDAATQYLGANRLFLSGNDERGIAYVLVGMGDLHGKLGLSETSASLYEIAAEIFLQHRVAYGLNQCAQRLSRAHLQWIYRRCKGQWKVGRFMIERLPRLLAKELVGDLKGLFPSSALPSYVLTGHVPPE